MSPQKACPSPSGRRWRGAPDEGSPPYDLVDLQNRGAGCPHPALARHPLPVGEGKSIDLEFLTISNLRVFTPQYFHRDEMPSCAYRRRRLLFQGVFRSSCNLSFFFFEF